MAKADYADLVKTVSGALTKINKKSQHAADMKMVLATHRVAETTNPNCSRIYIRGLSSITRTTPLSSRELEIRGRFDAVSKAVAVRAKDLMKMSSDQAAFLAQKDQPGGKKTMKSYLWYVCGTEWDQAHGA
jgi:hypothetical protein